VRVLVRKHFPEFSELILIAPTFPGSLNFYPRLKLNIFSPIDRFHLRDSPAKIASFIIGDIMAPGKSKIQKNMRTSTVFLKFFTGLNLLYVIVQL
jgi:hypothetical protein